MKRNLRDMVGAALAAAVLATSVGLVGCAGNSTTSTGGADTEATDTTADDTADEEADDTAAAAPGEAAGFTEIPIFEDEEADFLNVSAVYFQPVPMTDGNGIEGYDLHLEADIAALKNDYGFGVGDWVPYLTVDYEIIGSDGTTAAEGTFMEMSASDGPHYGANVALPDADTYTLEITIHSPEDNNYLLHTDAETGPGATSFDETDWPLVVTYEGWDYTPQEW